MTVRVVSHVPATVFKVPVEIEVTVQVRHWFLEMVDDVPDVWVLVLIVWSVQLIIKKLVVPRICPRVRHFKLLQTIVHVGVIRVAARDLDITTAAARVFSVVGCFDVNKNFIVGPEKFMNYWEFPFNKQSKLTCAQVESVATLSRFSKALKRRELFG